MAILVDLGLGLVSKTNIHIVMAFIGGPDDREALAVAWRMVGVGNRQGNTLSMARIVLVEAAEAHVRVNQ